MAKRKQPSRADIARQKKETAAARKRLAAKQAEHRKSVAAASRPAKPRDRYKDVTKAVERVKLAAKKEGAPMGHQAISDLTRKLKATVDRQTKRRKG